MKNVRIYLTLLGLVALFPGLRASAQNNEIAVVVNGGNAIDSISSAELRKIFSGDKQTWGNGAPISPFVRGAGTHEREVLLKTVVKMTDAQYADYWVKKVYSGQAAHEPLMVMSNAMQLDGVKAQKGGIALVSMGEIKGGVKVLKVDGMLPGSPGYPLK